MAMERHLLAPIYNNVWRSFGQKRPLGYTMFAGRHAFGLPWPGKEVSENG